MSAYYITFLLFEMVLVHAIRNLDPLRVLAVGGFFFCAGFGLLPLGSTFAFAAFTVAIWTLGEMLTLPLVSAVVAARAEGGSRGSYMGLYVLSFQAAFVLAMRNGGVASVTLDYLRPQAAPTHGDERLRVAGTRGVIETAPVERRATLTTAQDPPRELPLESQTDIFTRFARSLRGEAPPPLTLHEACRITEIALKAQQAAETGRSVSLDDSPYHNR